MTIANPSAIPYSNKRAHELLCACGGSFTCQQVKVVAK